MKVLRLSDLRAGHLYSPGNNPGNHFCKMTNRSLSHSVAIRIIWMKNSGNTIGNWTSNLPACNSVPEPNSILYLEKILLNNGTQVTVIISLISYTLWLRIRKSVSKVTELSRICYTFVLMEISLTDRHFLPYHWGKVFLMTARPLWIFKPRYICWDFRKGILPVLCPVSHICMCRARQYCCSQGWHLPLRKKWFQGTCFQSPHEKGK